MKNTLKRKCDFDLVFSKGKKVVSRSVVMVYIKSQSLKVGYCVSKKHGKAVQRNHIKRLLRSAWQNYKCQVGEFYIVFLPKVYREYSLKTFREDILYLLKKEKLINE